jgi:hypothetical protein
VAAAPPTGKEPAMANDRDASPPAADRVRLLRRLGAGWDRFWFTPGSPIGLAAIRVLAGSLVLWLLATLSVDLTRLFAAGGLVPPAAVEAWRGPSVARSPLDLLGSPTELWIAHGVALAIVLAMVLGIATRVTTVLSLVVLLSYVHRAPLLTTPAEPVLAMLLLYLCIGPSGSHWSVDAWWTQRRLAQRPQQLARWQATRQATWTATLATRLMQIHLTVIYLAMAFAKLVGGMPGDNGELYNAWWYGDAVWWLAAKPDSPLVNLAGLLHGHMHLINAWTLAILAFELGFAVLVWNRSARPVMLWIAVPMWLSLAVLTGLVPFCLAMLVANLAFVPPEAIRRCVAKMTRRAAATT